MVRTSMSFSLALVIALAACTQAPAPPRDTSEADAAAIRQLSDDWIAAYNAGDADAAGMTYAEDAISLPPDRPPVVGSEALVQRLRDFFTEFSASQTSTVYEVTVFGDRALARGTWSVRQTPKAGGAEQVRNGKWMELYNRQPDGSWKTWRWMWNEAPAGVQAGE
ncbi:MAG: SgcJ/EcaC family oxidoreductase [Gemmatimonadota bacterium]|nr:SgcJ/EcaC family oxidoreductase [Gemmatimonadota bacterium]